MVAPWEPSADRPATAQANAQDLQSLQSQAPGANMAEGMSGRAHGLRLRGQAYCILHGLFAGGCHKALAGPAYGIHENQYKRQSYRGRSVRQRSRPSRELNVGT